MKNDMQDTGARDAYGRPIYLVSKQIGYVVRGRGGKLERPVPEYWERWKVGHHMWRPKVEVSTYTF